MPLGSSHRKPFALALCALSACCLVLLGAPSAGAATVTHRAIVYGDSLASEAGPTIAQKFAGKGAWSLTLRVYPGTAVCNYLAELDDDIATIHPTVIVLEALGNSATDCMIDPATGQHYVVGSAAYYDRYRSDFETFFTKAVASGAAVVYVDSPPVEPPSLSPVTEQLITIANTAASQIPGVAVTRKPRNAVSKRGHFTWTKPCLKTETAAEGCTNGQITIRAPDGIHFCPDGINTTPPAWCDTYSSGAFRFGRAIVGITVKPPAPLA